MQPHRRAGRTAPCICPQHTALTAQPTRRSLPHGATLSAALRRSRPSRSLDPALRQRHGTTTATSRGTRRRGQCVAADSLPPVITVTLLSQPPACACMHAPVPAIATSAQTLPSESDIAAAAATVSRDTGPQGWRPGCILRHLLPRGSGRRGGPGGAAGGPGAATAGVAVDDCVTAGLGAP